MSEWLCHAVLNHNYICLESPFYFYTKAFANTSFLSEYLKFIVFGMHYFSHRLWRFYLFYPSWGNDVYLILDVAASLAPITRNI